MTTQELINKMVELYGDKGSIINTITTVYFKNGITGKEFCLKLIESNRNVEMKIYPVDILDT